MKPVHEIYEGIINTVSGIEVNLLDPIPSQISIEDIAHSLAYQCRFAGHVKRFYSVAQHSVVVAAMAPDALKKYALLHDAAEAYLQDVTAPLKQIWGPAYKLLEERFMKVISKKFDLDPELFTEVKPYDKRAVELEHQAFQCDKMHLWQTECLTLNIPVTVFGPDHGESIFMSAFYTLFGSAYIQ
jgi:5'-deoxynucleotidase YfbR-like HD superfamily hydrolase